MTSSTGASGPDIRQEVTLAFAAVMGNVWRVLRFAGLPMLGGLGLFLWLFWSNPSPDAETLQVRPEAMNLWIADHAGTLAVGSLLMLWGYGRFLVRWYRWTVLGDDASTLIDPGLGKRELRTIGWTIVVGLATIPAFFLLTLLAGALALIGGLAFGIAGAGELGANLGGQLGSLLGFFVVCYMVARLSPGVVPVALDTDSALARSWRETAPVATPSAMILWLIALPSNLLGLVGALGGGLVEDAAGLLSIPVMLAVYAASAIFTARLWQATLAPPTPVPSLDVEV